MLSYDVFAGQIDSQFNSFAESIKGIYWLAITRHSEALIGSKAYDYKGRMHFAAQTFIASATNMAKLHATDVTKGNETALNFLSSDINDMASRLSSISAETINVATQAIKRERLMKSTGMMTTGMPAKLETKARDRIGRSYEARYLVRLASRQYSINTHLTALKASGTEQIALRNASGDLVDVMTFSEGEKSLDALGAKYFHPNSNIKVEPYVTT